MSGKNKQTVVCVEVSLMPKFEDIEFIWCSSCHHVSTNIDWMENNFLCPMKNCNGKNGTDWNQIHTTHEKYPLKPELGKHYKL